MTAADGLEHAQIEEQVRDLAPHELDRYYFEVLKRTMECTYDTYVAAFRVWDHEVIWHDRRASRLGYLIFGSPSPETLTLPPRDFALYIIPPFAPSPMPEAQKHDALWLRLENADDAFRDTLKRYVAALELAADQLDEAEIDYENRAAEYLKTLYLWIDDHAADRFTLTFGGETALLGDWCERFGIPARACIPTEDASCLRDILNEVAGACLAGHFARLAPDYPVFPFYIPGSQRGRIMREVLRHLAGAPLTNGGQAVLEALGLLDNGMVDPLASPYALNILEILDAAPPPQILRRPDLISEDAGHGYFAPDRVRLEPEWTAALLASLVYAGEIALIIRGDRYAADRLSGLAALPAADLLAFEAVERLPGWNRQALQTLCDHLGLSRKTALNLARGATEPIQELFGAAAVLKQRMETARETADEGFPIWGEPLLDREGIQARQAELAAAIDFLDALCRDPGSDALRAFVSKAGPMAHLSKGAAVLEETEELTGLIHRLCGLTGFMTGAEAMLPSDHPWTKAALEVRETLQREMADPGRRRRPGFAGKARSDLSERRDAFIDLYLAAHNQEPGPRGCRPLDRADLRHSPLCPNCRFKLWET